MEQMETKCQTPRVDRFTWNIPKMRYSEDAWEIHDPSSGPRLQREVVPRGTIGQEKIAAGAERDQRTD